MSQKLHKMYIKHQHKDAVFWAT